jgi:hypothetical protein
MKPGNYVAAAKSAIANQYYLEGNFKALCNKAVRYAEKGVKFVIPPNGVFFDKGLKSIDGMPLRLPYPICVLEYEVTNGIEDSKERIIVAKETPTGIELYVLHSCNIEGWSSVPGHMQVDRVEGYDTLKLETRSAMDVVRSTYQNILKDPSTFLDVLGTKWAQRIVAEGDSDGKLWQLLLDSIEGDADTPKTSIAGVLMRTTTVGPMAEGGSTALADALNIEFKTVLAFLEVLRCSNVQAVPTGKKPAWKKDGSHKNSIYKVLTINGNNVGRSNESQGGTHASPREHLRRGHVRRLKEGRCVWVNATIVCRGASGSVEKDYKVLAEIAVSYMKSQ